MIILLHPKVVTTLLWRKNTWLKIAPSLKESRDGVLILTINRPNALNCLNMPLLETFQSTINEIAFDGSIRSVIITGSTEGRNGLARGIEGSGYDRG